MKSNTVKMNFDGHLINFDVDTASHITYLVYGGWYESLYGRGSCKYLISGCYFCPPTDPCDLDTLLAQKVEKLRYADGEVVKFVYRNVTLKVGERDISSLRVALLVGSSRTDDGVQPYALLGLSPPPLKPEAEIETPSFLKQLVKAGEIPHLAFSIHVSEFSVGIGGHIVLGGATGQANCTAIFSLVKPPWGRGS
ncbi:hypothetical protein FOZ61_010064 [Perkinsus olseni]|uniref:Uncharacterized protein n=1 Tax=Perkinsus olseni TaxID=32597 RepID=A0A7J6KSE3_PEROL|nr:hypothetical protein FOL46_001211 [Perkinsus olseni]KAF4651905.1 hypothetical protein FOZ61_010064 [Perkinsus olseni]